VIRLSAPSKFDL